MDDILIAFDNDPSTELRGFFESCADEAKQMCANNNRGYISLFPPQLTNSDLISKMDNIKVCIVAAHGKHDGIVNEEGEEFISTRTTNYALSGKFLYTISCSTAIDLLPHLLSIGMKLYVGYNNAFKVGEHDSIFLECAMSGIKSFISGKNFEDAKEDMKSTFNKGLDELESLNFIESLLLYDDMESLVFEGNGNTTLKDLK